MSSRSFCSLLYECFDRHCVCPVLSLLSRSKRCLGKESRHLRCGRAMSNAGYSSKVSIFQVHLSQSVLKARYAQNRPQIHITTCHHRPPFPAHQIGSAGIGKDLSAAGYILGDAVGSQSIDLDAHCCCPDYADWLATAGGVGCRGAHFPACNHP